MAFSTALGRSVQAHPLSAAHAHFAFPGTFASPVPSLVNPTGHLCCAVLDLLSVRVFIYSNHYALFCMLCVNIQLCWKNGVIFRSTMDMVEETKIIQMVLGGVGFSEIECM